MAKENFERALALVLQSEGGNSDDRRDPGGRTSRGVTQREYDAYRKRLGLLPADVWKASDEDIRAIYYNHYWRPWGDVFAPGIDYLWFDMAVNTGPVQAAKTLQRAAGVKADGFIGPITLLAIEQAEPKALIAAISEQRRSFYRLLKTFPIFGKGWLNRVASAERDAARMAA